MSYLDLGRPRSRCVRFYTYPRDAGDWFAWLILVEMSMEPQETRRFVGDVTARSALRSSFQACLPRRSFDEDLQRMSATFAIGFKAIRGQKAAPEAMKRHRPCSTSWQSAAVA